MTAETGLPSAADDGRVAVQDASAATTAQPLDLPSSSEILGRISTELKPLNPNAEHERRLVEAIVIKQEAEAAQVSDNRSLRMAIAVGTSIAIGIQLLVADAVFAVYGATNAWDIPGSTISAWLAAAVVQVIGLGVIIVRGLFRD